MVVERQKNKEEKKKRNAHFGLERAVSEEGELEREMRENLHLLSKIYGDRVVGIRRAKI